VGPNDRNESESELEGSSNDTNNTLREIPRGDPEAQGVEDSGPDIAISEDVISGPAIAVLEDANNDRRISSRAETLHPFNFVLAICQFGFLYIVSNTATFL
jgi:hypothetical protein